MRARATFVGGSFGILEQLETRRLMAGEAVTQLTLVNADTDQRIGQLVDLNRYEVGRLTGQQYDRRRRRRP